MQHHIKRVNIAKTTEEIVQTSDVQTRTVEDTTSIRESSPFFQYFNQIWQRLRKAGSKGISNPLFKPTVIDVIMKGVMAPFPLWSGIMLGDFSRHNSKGMHPESSESHATNNMVENHFEKITKDTLPRRGRRLRPGQFIDWSTFQSLPI